MEFKQVESLGMLVDEWSHKSCDAIIGIGDGWATIYMISSDEKRKGHATELLTEAKKHYEGLGKKFGSSLALNDNMRRILKRLGIEEYKSK